MALPTLGKAETSHPGEGCASARLLPRTEGPRVGSEDAVCPGMVYMWAGDHS